MSLGNNYKRVLRAFKCVLTCQTRLVFATLIVDSPMEKYTYCSAYGYRLKKKYMTDFCKL